MRTGNQQRYCGDSGRKGRARNSNGRAENRTGKARRRVELARASMKMHWRSAAGKSHGGADHRHGYDMRTEGVEL